ncbi:hypothetical protein EDF57_10649 [Novosphingobium sp. PhB55]|uniref:hypothetical protein n=1 Tax=Novosphingobium sp. PhB55 TaxID=2485106 RepID=UPI00106490F4|nr:hypothetical protein [Novosphingobium sp. PhB55]TDW63094.1 hypothetical protein EDF57_10649 [Novosphingobium sp. PhB55]
MSIRISSFSGEIPRLLGRLLPNNHAQLAQNTKLENGGLVPIRRGRYVQRLEEPARTIYQFNDRWLSWPLRVDAQPAPIAANRLYYTGDGAPKIMVGTDVYDLALPAPTGALTIAIEGSETPDPDLEATILYTYTWVTEFDEESEPAPASNELLWSAGLNVSVSGFALPPINRRFNRMRIYRSQTSALGATAFYFIKEMPVQTAPWVDVVDDNTIQEQLPSLEYNVPPEDLTGLVSMPNGMMAGFVGKRLYFCEPWRPHAWPEKYILTTDFEIVGLGVFGSALAVMTTGQPYIVAGTAPDSMTMERLEVNLPCVSAQGIVDLGYTIAYPSPDGLVVVSTSGANLMTRELLSRDDWQRLNPFSFVAGSFAGRYLCSYGFTDSSGIEQRGILIVDLTGAQPFLIRAGDDADGMFTDPKTGALYLLRGGQDIYEWDALAMPFGEQVWRSKKFVLPAPTNYGCILIEGEDTATPEQRETARIRTEAAKARNRELIDTDATGGAINAMPIGRVTFAGSLLTPIEEGQPSFSATVYADGKAVATVYKLNEPVRLPSGFLAGMWEVEIRGNQMVTAISVVGSPSELQQ